MIVYRFTSASYDYLHQMQLVPSSLCECVLSNVMSNFQYFMLLKGGDPVMLT